MSQNMNNKANTVNKANIVNKDNTDIIIISTETIYFIINNKPINLTYEATPLTNPAINPPEKSTELPEKILNECLTKTYTKEDITNIRNIFMSEYTEQRRNNIILKY